MEGLTTAPRKSGPAPHEAHRAGVAIGLFPSNAPSFSIFLSEILEVRGLAVAFSATRILDQAFWCSPWAVAAGMALPAIVPSCRPTIGHLG